MSQNKFDFAEILINNRFSLEENLIDEVETVIDMEEFFANQTLASYYLEGFVDFIIYKIQGFLVNDYSQNHETVLEIVDKSFIVDLCGEEYLKPSYWRNKL